MTSPHGAEPGRGPDERDQNSEPTLESFEGLGVQPSKLHRDHLMTEAAGQRREIITSIIQANAVQHAPYLTDDDLVIAAVNGMSDQTSYILPPVPPTLEALGDSRMAQALRESGSSPDSHIVSRETNSIFFYHALNSHLVNNAGNTDSAAALNRMSILSCEPHIYPEYIQILQNTARFLHNAADDMRERVAKLCAVCAALETLYGSGAALGALPPMIKVENGTSEALLLRYASQFPVLQSFRPGARLLIAGAGYNSLSHLGVMAQLPQFRFDLWDNDPFTADVFEHLFEILNPRNITFSRGNIADIADAPDKFDAVIASMLYSATEDDTRAFARGLKSALVPGSPIHVVIPVERRSEQGSNAQTWEDALHVASIPLESQVRIRGVNASVLKTQERPTLLAKDAAELIEAISENAPPPPISGYALMRARTRRTSSSAQIRVPSQFPSQWGPSNN